MVTKRQHTEQSFGTQPFGHRRVGTGDPDGDLSFERLVRCLNDLGEVTREILTDRDTVFWISASGTLSLSGRSSSRNA
jgi:hypothetical protein